jgi:protein-L-isoaspartate(D-aspartate) O-methyltransferase
MSGRRILIGMTTARLHTRYAILTVIALAACGGAVAERQPASATFERARRQMVDEQMAARDIKDPRVLDAMQRVPRHEFVPDALRGVAYQDSPLPIGHDQTISQPYIVAYMTEALDLAPSHKVLEIGSGSGYQAAILGELAGEVYTIEIVEPLADRARQVLERLGYENVHVRTGNGYLGWPEQAPFDRVMVTAAPDQIPPALIEQLKIGGLMAIPVGAGDQELRILRRTETGMEILRTLPVRFVPMTGKPKP